MTTTDPAARCTVADANTDGRYCCTRRPGHDGPCAAVPVSSSVPSGEPITPGTPLALVASVYAWRDRWESVVSRIAVAELNETLRDFGRAHLAREQSAPSGEGIPESEVERAARHRLDRYSGGVRQWDVWPKNALASRRMDLRIVLHRLRKAEREVARLTREQATRTAALDALREARNGCGGWLTRRLQCGERAAGHVQLCRNCSTALDAAIATLLGGGDAITGLRNAVDHACAGCGDAEATRETDDGVELCDDCFVAVPVTQEGDDA